MGVKGVVNQHGYDRGRGWCLEIPLDVGWKKSVRPSPSRSPGLGRRVARPRGK